MHRVAGYLHSRGRGPATGEDCTPGDSDIKVFKDDVRGHTRVDHLIKKGDFELIMGLEGSLRWKEKEKALGRIRLRLLRCGSGCSQVKAVVAFFWVDIVFARGV